MNWKINQVDAYLDMRYLGRMKCNHQLTSYEYKLRIPKTHGIISIKHKCFEFVNAIKVTKWMGATSVDWYLTSGWLSIPQNVCPTRKIKGKVSNLKLDENETNSKSSMEFSIPCLFDGRQPLIRLKAWSLKIRMTALAGVKGFFLFRNKKCPETVDDKNSWAS